MSDARAVCEAQLVGLDADIIEYVVGMLEDEAGDRADTIETISSFLLSSEYVPDEEAAAAKCEELFAALNTEAQPAAAAAEAEPLKLLDAPLSMAVSYEADNEKAKEKKAEEAGLGYGGRLVELNEALEERKKKNAEERKRVKLLYEKVKAQQAEVERQLEEAKLAAVRLRREGGAYMGAVESPPFSLPNPGGGPDLLERASLTLVRGRRYGVIGRNGKGKSTLLRALAARQVGSLPPSLTVHYVSQEMQLTEETSALTPAALVVAADVERTMLLAEQEALQEADDATADDERLQRVLDRLEVIEADSAGQRADRLLTHLGFSEELKARPLAALSGGWRVRAALAAAIFARPDLLLLDEPTNHLSIGAVLWLARELSTSEVWAERMVLIVSHDRFFLDEVITDVLHISGAARRLTQSHGSYGAWAKKRASQQQATERAAALRQAEIDKLQSYAGHGFKYGGSSSQINKMKQKEKQAEKLEAQQERESDELAALQEDNELPLALKAGGRLPGFVAQLLGVGFGYKGGPRLFRGAEFSVDSASRIVLLGENGNGKTTLVKLLLGELEPTEGEVRRAAAARIGLVNQHHADQLDLTQTALQFMLDKFPGDGSLGHEQLLRSHLNGCGVTGELQTLPGSALSGGQRSRVALAAVSYTQPHVLVLDEPTNNLDLESVAALAECVKAFEGGVVLVSHDTFFVSQVANEVWVVGGGKVERATSFEAYRKQQLAKIK